jgi:4-diphosphocytidyl-2-C-methyl-D-erythritol kinase
VAGGVIARDATAAATGARTIAPAKLNATLLVGPVRAGDGRHELTSVMQSLTLADDVALVPAGPGAADDAVQCPGVTGDNLALRALTAFRAATGWAAPPLTVRIVKRIPVAAGMAGGSTDAAAVLRLAAHLSGHDDPALLWHVAAGLGADVPHGLQPGLALAARAGEELERYAGVLPGAVVVVRADVGLSTPSVFRRADELRPPRTAEELAAWRARVATALEPLRAAPPAGATPPADATPAPAPYPATLAVNDLGDAAVDLAPVVGEHLAALRAAGAAPALVCGSGPTTVGWFADAAAAEAAAVRLRAGGLDALVALPSAGAPIHDGPA